MTSQIPMELISKLPTSELHCISYRNLYRSAKGLRKFTKYYFPIHNLSIHDYFNYYAVLGLVHALVYQTDDELEALQREAFASGKRSLNQPLPWNSKGRIILSVLEELNFAHPTIQKYVEDIEEYVNLETKLLLSETVTYADVIRTAQLRISDFRLLHSILIRMLGKPYRTEVFDLLWPLEVGLDLLIDLAEYNNDVTTNDFNTYRMFVRLYEKEAPHYIKAELERCENLFQERLKQFSSDERKIYLEYWSILYQDHQVPSIPEPILEE